MARPREIESLQKQIWAGSLPLEIRLSAAESRIYDQTDPYLIHAPRLSYLPFLLPRLHAFFTAFLIDPCSTQPHDGWFSFEDVPLKWHYPIGLLFDLFSGAEPASPGQHQHTEGARHGGADGDAEEQGRLPWRLTIHFSEWPEERLVRLDAEGGVMHDAFVNSVKEADFLRNGTAKGIMSLSKEDSTTLWTAVQQHDLALFSTISPKLLNAPGSHLRHIPLKIYLPSSPRTSHHHDAAATGAQIGSLRVVQGLITPNLTT
ncbi:MAG: autophagy protein 5, partial [Candelina submexicana]